MLRIINFIRASLIIFQSLRYNFLFIDYIFIDLLNLIFLFIFQSLFGLMFEITVRIINQIIFKDLYLLLLALNKAIWIVMLVRKNILTILFVLKKHFWMLIIFILQTNGFLFIIYIFWERYYVVHRALVITMCNFIYFLFTFLW